MNKLAWLDIRGLGPIKDAIVEEAVHQRIDAIVTDDLADLDALPPTVKRVFFPRGQSLPADFGPADLVIVDPTEHPTPAELATRHTGTEFGRFVEVVDAPTLEDACTAARGERWTLLKFRDPTKIPLEIVLAAAHAAEGSLITEVADVEEAGIVFGVLEHGSDGVMLAPGSVGAPTALKQAAETTSPDLDLVHLEVTAVTHVGMGERACVDTCTHFREDEGMLVGSYSKGMVLCVSETHPLPYMPTRPFRVNAGAIHSYTLSENGRTNYLSELRSGSRVQAVDVKGQTRMVAVGRVKIETRPLLSVDAVAPTGETVNLILQDDWHVRVLGPGGAVLNSTELKPGDVVLGYLPDKERHVGYPIHEYCLEQ
ncbi:3-amino-4-hydroxybenzoic acid synthase [Prauserella shujinwangii]|uniref:3-amino-4-hydroxybenzoic acid synthase n=1 Tax=Prauserella shujinwangii TaxID=1453103 RepID=A0A2T0LTB6_9PSEU|nr:3-dehydroquinate synthase II [Prauserella shujinwangii]PRX46965.1 3-amino-4-hydroxybenzoic acid synthase [Prauserella shujinwangii]